MTEELSNFKVLDAKLVGSNVVMFRLEDGTSVKVVVHLTKAGVAINNDGSFKLGPTGDKIYNMNITPSIDLIAADKTFRAPLPPNLPQTRAKPVEGKYS